MSQSILVVGAGITGICIAENLRRAGQSVTLVDKVNPGDPAQTSYGNAGLLAREAIGPIVDPSIFVSLPKWLLSPISPVKLQWTYLLKLLPWAAPALRNGFKDRAKPIVTALNELIYDTLDQHLNLAKGTKAAQYIHQGALTLLYRRNRDFTANRFLNTLKADLKIDWVEKDLAKLRKHDPMLGDRYTFGVAYPNHGWLNDPAAYVAALADHFVANGGQLLKRTVVRVTSDRVICQNSDDLFADTIILATGAWSKELAEPLGHKIPLEGERGYHIILKNPSHMPKEPYLVTDAKYGLTPMANGLRCAGTSEFAALSAKPSLSQITHLEKSIRQVYPNLTWDTLETWMGYRPTLPDSLPMIGRARSAPNVIFAFGGQHLGITMGPKLGQIVRDIVLDVSPNINLSPYMIDRFD